MADDYTYGGLAPNYVSQIQGMEGWNPNAYSDGSQYSIGYGTKAQYPGEVIDKAEGMRRLDAELGKAAGYVDSAAPNAPPGISAALKSLTYNAGPGWINSGLGSAVKQGDWDTARQHFAQYVNSGGQYNPGLAKRRQQELQWWDGNSQPPFSSAFADARNNNMDPMQAAFAGNNTPAYDPGYNPNAGLFDRLRQGGPGALIGAPQGIFPGANGNPGYNLGNALQRAGLFAQSVSNPTALFALGGLQPQRKFVPIGTDDMGNPRYGFVDERTGSIIPANGAGGNAGGLSGVGGGGISDVIRDAQASGKTGLDILNDPRVPAPIKAASMSYLNGTQPFNAATLMRTSFGKAVLTMTSAVEPGADLTGRSAGAKDWATKSAEMMRRASQAAYHGSELVDGFSSLNNTQYPAWNAVKNAASEQTGWGTPTAVRQNVTAFAHELSAFTGGGDVSDKRFGAWAEAYPINGSPAQQRAAVGMGAQLFEDAIKAAAAKRLTALGPTVDASKGPIVPQSVTDALGKMKAFASGGQQQSTLPKGVNGFTVIPATQSQ